MSGANNWKIAWEVLVNGLMIALIFMLAINYSLPVTAGPMGDPEPADPPGAAWSEEDPPVNPEEVEEQTVSSVRLR